MTAPGRGPARHPARGREPAVHRPTPRHPFSRRHLVPDTL